MSDLTSGSVPSADAGGDADPSPDGSSRERGLLGRLFDAIAPQEPDEAERALSASMRQVLPGLANLRRLRVADVSIPKAEIVAIPRDIDRDGLIAVFRDSGFSRLPVYNETLDKPIGLLLLKDLVLKQGFDLGGRSTWPRCCGPCSMCRRRCRWWCCCRRCRPSAPIWRW
jgi:Putative Mg2+ and Co2+ transporter CorC